MIIPVLDIKGGIAVSGKSGMRNTYQPLKTVFHPSSDPQKIARSLKDAGARTLYIADLDAIEGVGSNREIVNKINKTIPVMLDAGVSDVESAKKALIAARRVIIATETLKSFKEMDEIFNNLERDRLIISVDIKDDKILSRHFHLDFAKLRPKLEELKAKEIILLDISRVGTEEGFNPQYLNELAGFEDSIILGGGITPQDIVSLKERGFSRFLVGSALHSGKLSYNF